MHKPLSHPPSIRCSWAGTDPLYIAYHDTEWGVPSHDDRHLFEMLVLEGFQAGLSWITILKKRDAFKKAFAHWDVKKIAAFGSADIERCMNDAGIVRNRLKINAAIANAKAFIAVKKECGSFDSYIWKFTGGKALEVKKVYRELKEVPCQTRESELMSKELIKRGFRFVGPVVCYSFMQAVGMVDDHVAGCWRFTGKERFLRILD